MTLYQRIAGLLPSNIIAAFKREMHYIGMEADVRRFVGFLVLFSIGGAIAASIFISLMFQLNFLVSFIASFVLFAGGAYLVIEQKAEAIGKDAEKFLPDVLELVASNIKAGLTTERALFTSARPEFGNLSEEIKTVSKRILSGERIEDSLTKMAEKIKSRVVERTIWLLTQGIKSGGQISDLLIQLSSDLRDENAMREEIKANVSMYMILIFFAGAFGAPLLFGISSIIVGVLEEQTGQLQITPEQIEGYSQMSSIGRFFGVPTSVVTETFVAFFAATALVVTGVFASFTIGAITAGSEKQGLKYMPLILGISLVLFFVIRMTLGEMLGSMSTMMT